MSSINTNGIDVNYPVPGVNNNSQGFRDNFASIKTNLNTAGTEITDLQNKVVVKQALANSTVNNDMANTLISNALTRSFRASTYNLGGALSDVIKVNASLGDVQYGTVAPNSNVTLQFGNWAPAGTQQTIELNLSFNDNNSYVSFPSTLGVNYNSGGMTLENASNVANTVTISAPYGVTEIDFRISTLDCGNTLIIEPYNRPRQTTQIQQRTPSPVGFPGDVAGTTSIDANYLYICTANYNATTTQIASTGTNSTGNVVNLSTTTGITLNDPVVFTGSAFANTLVPGSIGGLNEGQIYFVKSIPSGTTISVSATRTGGVAGANVTLTTEATPANTSLYATFYSGSDIWKRISLTTW